MGVKFSSAKYHADQVLTNPLLTKKDWQEFLREESAEIDMIRKGTRTGRPVGDKEFVKKLRR